MATKVPYFNNYQIRTLALGIAYQLSSDELYYLSTLGPTISLKSLWASLVSNKKRIVCQPWVYSDLVGKRPIKAFYQPLPQTAHTHLIACTESPSLLIITDGEGAGASEPKRQALLAARQDELYGKFVAILNNITDAPVLPEWGKVIWEAVRYDSSAITELIACGDCLGAWLINTSYNWKQMLTDFIQQRIIAIPEVKDE